MRSKFLHILFFSLLLSTNPSLADSIDQIYSGDIGQKAHCSVCGGRVLCGATDESVKLEYFKESKNIPVRLHCRIKTSELEKAIYENRGSPSTPEQERFLKIKSILKKLSAKKARGKNKRRPASISEKDLEGMTQHRLVKGFSYSELKSSSSKKFLKKLEGANLVLPILSYESFKQISTPTKNAYTAYVEQLIVTEPFHLYRRDDGLVVFTDRVNGNSIKSLRGLFSGGRGGSAGPIGGGSGGGQIAQASNLNAKQKRGIAAESEKLADSETYKNNKWISPYDPKNGKLNPYEYNYHKETDPMGFIQSTIFRPKTFCRIGVYAQNQSAISTSLDNVAKRFGGASSLGQSVKARDMKQQVKTALSSNEEKQCVNQMQKFFKGTISSLPNLTARSVVNTAYKKKGQFNPAKLQAIRYAEQHESRDQRMVASVFESVKSDPLPTTNQPLVSPSSTNKTDNQTKTSKPAKNQKNKKGAKLSITKENQWQTASIGGKEVLPYNCEFEWDEANYWASPEHGSHICSQKGSHSSPDFHNLLQSITKSETKISLDNSNNPRMCQNQLIYQAVFSCLETYPATKWSKSTLNTKTSGVINLGKNKAYDILENCRQEALNGPAFSNDILNSQYANTFRLYFDKYFLNSIKLEELKKEQYTDLYCEKLFDFHEGKLKHPTFGQILRDNNDKKISIESMFTIAFASLNTNDRFSSDTIYSPFLGLNKDKIPQQKNELSLHNKNNFVKYCKNKITNHPRVSSEKFIYALFDKSVNTDFGEEKKEVPKNIKNNLMMFMKLQFLLQLEDCPEGNMRTGENASN